MSRITNHFIAALLVAIEQHDAYTAGHSERVAHYACHIARQMGMSAMSQRHLYIGGLLHDVGKLILPDYVLNKRGALTTEEWTIMKQHPTVGEKLLRKVYRHCPWINEEEQQAVCDIVLSHHERLDGKGYPYGLRGEQIPTLSRILAVADAYDAMTSNRPYRSAMDSEQALAILVEGAGSQFWLPAVDAMQVIIANPIQDIERGESDHAS